MSRSGTLAALAVVVVLVSRLPAPSAGHDDKKDTAALHRPDDLKWQDGPPSLPPARSSRSSKATRPSRVRSCSG